MSDWYHKYGVGGFGRASDYRYGSLRRMDGDSADMDSTLSADEEEIKIRDLPAELKNSIQALLQPTMTCLTYRDRDGRRLVQGGSGTLVHSGKEYGILTAAHVVDRVKREAEIQLSIPAGLGFVTVEKEAAEFLKCDNANFGESGPDIGFIRLAPHTVSTLRSYLSFVNLETHRNKILKDKVPIARGVWCETGFPDYLGSSWRSDNTVVTQIFGLVSVGDAEELPNQDQFDYYQSKVTYGYGEGIPPTFGGLSGGGLWQVTLGRAKDGRLQILDRYLSGVVFYETERIGDYRYIKSHGHRSIYNYVVPKLIVRPGDDNGQTNKS